MAGRDSLLKLNDKTVAVFGPFGATSQMIISALAEQGADVALLGKDQPEAQRYVDHLSEQREIYPSYGRAGVIPISRWDQDGLKDALSRTVHSFGRLDAVVDLAGGFGTPSGEPLSQALAEVALPFLTSRPRSRLVFVHHTSQFSADCPGLASQQAIRDLHNFIRDWAKRYSDKNLTINALELGASEEYIMRRFPKARSIREGFEELRKISPGTRLIEPNEISACVMFLCSPLSQALSGQVLRLDHGR